MRFIYLPLAPVIDSFRPVSGTGIMCMSTPASCKSQTHNFSDINNIGSMAQVLYFAMQRKNGDDYDPVQAARWQAGQVSTISVANFSSRIIIGLLNITGFVPNAHTLTGFISDFCKQRFSCPRSSFLVVVSFFFFISQVVAANVDNVRNLHFASGFLGFGYGCMHSLFPMVCLEWFGLRACFVVCLSG